MLIPVALRKESVDRNSGLMSVVRFAAVALRKESVDRNCRDGTTAAVSGRVALRKESVDRNAAWTGVLRDMHHASLSARRAWIEILKQRVDFEEEPRRSPQGERG